MIMGLIRSLDSMTRAASAVGAVGAGIVLVAMISLILAEIVLRTTFQSSTYILEEMVGYGVATMSFLGMGYTLNTGAHIRMNLLLLPMGDSLIRRLFEIICCIGALSFTSMASWFFFLNVRRDFVRGYASETMAETPLWIPKGLLLAGLIIFVVQMFVYMLRVIANDVSFAGEAADSR